MIRVVVVDSAPAGFCPFPCSGGLHKIPMDIILPPLCVPALPRRRHWSSSSVLRYIFVGSRKGGGRGPGCYFPDSRDNFLLKNAVDVEAGEKGGIGSF